MKIYILIYYFNSQINYFYIFYSMIRSYRHPQPLYWMVRLNFYPLDFLFRLKLKYVKLLNIKIYNK